MKYKNKKHEIPQNERVKQEHGIGQPHGTSCHSVSGKNFRSLKR